MNRPVHFLKGDYNTVPAHFEPVGHLCFVLTGHFTMRGCKGPSPPLFGRGERPFEVLVTVRKGQPRATFARSARRSARPETRTVRFSTEALRTRSVPKMSTERLVRVTPVQRSSRVARPEAGSVGREDGDLGEFGPLGLVDRHGEGRVVRGHERGRHAAVGVEEDGAQVAVLVGGARCRRRR